MNAFDSQNAYYKFAQNVRTGARWVLNDEASSFIKAVRKSAHSRAVTLQPGRVLFRSQLGTDIENAENGAEWEHPVSAARMIPDARLIKEGGRANPAGVAYLYGATDERTALAEMRPWVSESLTLATFEAVKPIKLVACERKSEVFFRRYLESEHTPAELEEYVWNDIGAAFAQPVSREDRESAYVATQILAQAFQAEGFEGVAYRSSLERGTNVVIFNLTHAKLVHRFAYTLKRVRYDFKAVPNHAIRRIKTTRDSILEKIQTDSNKPTKPIKTGAAKELKRP